MDFYDETTLKRLEENTYKDPITGCWLFSGYTNPMGYGRVCYKGKTELLNRVSLHIFRGLDLDNPNIQALHKSTCTSKRCWNPDHLYEGIHSDNMRDRSDDITHCPRGHEYTPENTQIIVRSGSGYRNKRCRICHNEDSRNRYRQVGR